VFHIPGGKDLYYQVCCRHRRPTVSSCRQCHLIDSVTSTLTLAPLGCGQVLGHAWDHETKDFKVVYRPLYHCGHKPDGYEAHIMAISHFSRWDTKFKRIPNSQVPKEALSRVLPGPFWADGEWEAGSWTTPNDLAPSSPKRVGLSGLGTRSHHP